MGLKIRCDGWQRKYFGKWTGPVSTCLCPDVNHAEARLCIGSSCMPGLYRPGMEYLPARCSESGKESNTITCTVRSHAHMHGTVLYFELFIGHQLYTKRLHIGTTVYWLGSRVTLPTVQYSLHWKRKTENYSRLRWGKQSQIWSNLLKKYDQYLYIQKKLL
jgi:hypothetical protein